MIPQNTKKRTVWALMCKHFNPLKINCELQISISVPTLLPKLALSGDMENVFLLRATCLWFSAWLVQVHDISSYQPPLPACMKAIAVSKRC